VGRVCPPNRAAAQEAGLGRDTDTGNNFLKTVIHVNQNKIRSNQKTGERKPVITVKTYKSNRYAHSVEIKGMSKVFYSPDKPLGCGARVWIETESEVVLR